MPEAARVSIVDSKCDPNWLECVIEDIWEMVKVVRRRSGPKEQVYRLTFEGTSVDVIVRRV